MGYKKRLPTPLNFLQRAEEKLGNALNEGQLFKTSIKVCLTSSLLDMHQRLGGGS